VPFGVPYSLFYFIKFAKVYFFRGEAGLFNYDIITLHFEFMAILRIGALTLNLVTVTAQKQV